MFKSLVMFFVFALVASSALITSVVLVMKKLRFFNHMIPLLILVSIFLPLSIRTDYLLVAGLFGVMLIRQTLENVSPRFNKVLLLFAMFVAYNIIATTIYSVFNNSFLTLNFASITMSQFWIRILLLGYIGFNMNIDSVLLRRFLSIFYGISVLILLHGIMEVLGLVPPPIQAITELFIPPKNMFMYGHMKNMLIFRSTSIMGHPTIFGYFALFIFCWTYYCKERLVKWLPRIVILMLAFVAGLGSISKVFLMGIVVFFGYEFVIRKRNYGVFLVGLTVFTLFFTWIYFNGRGHQITLFHTLNYNVSKLVDEGFYAFAFRTRFDSETGIVANSLPVIERNYLFGVGANIIPGVFYGDSFYVSSILKYGIIGSCIFIFFIVELILQLRRASSLEDDPYFAAVLQVLLFMFLLNFIVGIGTQPFTLTRISDIMYFLSFLLLNKMSIRQRVLSA